MSRKYASVYFSPRRGAADQVIGFIDRCHERVDAAVYSITHEGITQALLRAHKRGVAVQVLTDKVQASSRYARDEILEKAGVALLRDTQSGSMHNKFIIGDGKAVGTGSFNWTKNADNRNAENFVIVRLSYIVRAFQEEFDKLWVANG